LLRKLEGLSEYDTDRPMTRTGTNLLGLVKHVASVCEARRDEPDLARGLAESDRPLVLGACGGGVAGLLVACSDANQGQACREWHAEALERLAGAVEQRSGGGVVAPILRDDGPRRSSNTLK
jgi:hypothetical protein